MVRRRVGGKQVESTRLHTAPEALRECQVTDLPFGSLTPTRASRPAVRPWSERRQRASGNDFGAVDWRRGGFADDDRAGSRELVRLAGLARLGGQLAGALIKSVGMRSFHRSGVNEAFPALSVHGALSDRSRLIWQFGADPLMNYLYDEQ